MKNRTFASAKTHGDPVRDAIPVNEFERRRDAWLLACEIDQHSNDTLTLRRFVLGKLLWFLQREQRDQCGLDELRSFLAYATNGHTDPAGRWGNPRLKRKLKPVTIASYHRELRAWCNWLLSENVLDASPMERIPTPQYREDQVQPFTHEQISALLKAAEKTRCPKRNVALLLFMLDTGLRASEVCSLKISEVSLIERELRVLGKGRKERMVIVAKTTAKALYEYLREDQRDGHEPLFPSEQGSHLTREGLRLLYYRLGEKAKLTGVRCSPHTMRHTFAVEFLRGGGSEMALMMFMGHTDLEMTRRYVALAKADLRNQHNQASPVERWRNKK